MPAPPHAQRSVNQDTRRTHAGVTYCLKCPTLKRRIQSLVCCLFVFRLANHLPSSTGPTGSGLCPKGFYCPEGTAVPIPSPKGFFSDLEGMVSASVCLPGYYSPTIEVTCKLCVTRCFFYAIVFRNLLACTEYNLMCCYAPRLSYTREAGRRFGFNSQRSGHHCPRTRAPGSTSSCAHRTWNATSRRKSDGTGHQAQSNLTLYRGQPLLVSSSLSPNLFC